MGDIDRSTPIERIPNPDPDTEERNEMADVIEAEWHSDLSLRAIAEKAGYSRQHVKNTLDSHFRVAEEQPQCENGNITIQIDVPADANRDTFVDAWLRGYKSGYRAADL